MKGFRIGLGIVVASFAFAAAPAFAQPRDTGGGAQAAGAVDRGSGGGAPSSGGAVDRGSGGGGGSVSSAGGGSSSSSSMGGSSSDFARSTPSAVSSPSISMGDRGAREFAPRHREGFTAGNSGFSFRDDSAQATPRSSGPSGGSGGGGGSAVTRGSGSSSSGSSGSSGGGSSASGSGDGARTPSRTRTGPAPEMNASSPNNASGAREVPSWSRPRGDRPASGTAVERTVPPPDRNGGYGGGRYGYYDPFYGYGYGGYYGYGFGFGYGCGLSCGYYPYGFGMGYGLYSGFPYYGDGFGDPYGGYTSGSGGYTTSYGRGEQGNLKLKVKPRSAKVYVDGYFVGYVDQFDGSFQKLALNTGRHKVEVKAEGYETAEFDVLINPEQTVTFQGDLKRIQ